jgi:hypothetical protein
MATAKKAVSYGPGDMITVKNVKSGNEIEVPFEHFATVLYKQRKYVPVEGESQELRNAVRAHHVWMKEHFED